MSGTRITMIGHFDKQPALRIKMPTVDVEAIIRSGGGFWREEEPASTESLELLRAAVPTGIPESYFQLLGFSNGGEGDLGIKPGWFCPWRAEEVVSANESYKINEFYGSYFGFGSSGGGELLAFDLSDPLTRPIVMIASIGGDPWRIADDFDDFLQHVARSVD